ncbi:MAG TPA: amino acid permease [Chloroflexi bacterium]|nr:amino acid permease [Chloroflexota bacterium]
MPHRIRTFFFGSPLPSSEMAHTRLGVFRALASFSPDALSSITYANQEIFLGLAVAGSLGLAYTLPIGLVISAILFIVATSYYQTIQAYPSGGGSYVVARENLGRFPSLLTGAALLFDYLLTAAVSLSAGVDALSSAFPSIGTHRVQVALLLLAMITIINLRGVRETGTVLAIPVYFFVASYAVLVFYGLLQIILGNPIAIQNAPPESLQPLSLFLLVRAFSSGSTALTGIEAISDSVPAFKEPIAKKAGQALIIMAITMAFLFLGTLGLIQYYQVVPSGSETILSALARALFGNSIPYYFIQITTLAILTVAANTSFTGFPRVAVFLAKDKFLPNQFQALGDRLVFSNGILILSFSTAVVILLFGGRTHAMVPLFAIGAFLAFTLSQTGMVLHWKNVRGKFWKFKALLNGIGGLTTGAMLAVVGISKFLQGAWITFLVIPFLVFLFLRIERHYLDISEQLSLDPSSVVIKAYQKIRLVIPISGIHKGILDAVRYALSISDQITAVYVEIEPGAGERIEQKWKAIFPDLPIVVIPSPYRSVIQPLLDFLDEYDEQSADGMLAGVVIPEFVTVSFWENMLHNQMAWLIKFTLLYRRRKLGFQRMIIDIPHHLQPAQSPPKKATLQQTAELSDLEIVLPETETPAE